MKLPRKLPASDQIAAAIDVARNTIGFAYEDRNEFQQILPIISAVGMQLLMLKRNSKRKR
jgi:hypothetical protein